MAPHLCLAYIGEIVAAVVYMALAWIGAIIGTLVMAYRIWVVGPKPGQPKVDTGEFILLYVSAFMGGMGLMWMVLIPG